MRYLTRGWANGELPDDEADKARDAYWAHLASIEDRLPPEMLRLTREVTLHDGVIEQIAWNAKEQLLEATLICDDRANGLARVELRYFGAQLGRERIAALRRAALSRETELLYDELDVGDDGLLCHRILFSPNEEVTLDFERIEVQIEPCADARVLLYPAFYEEFPDD